MGFKEEYTKLLEMRADIQVLNQKIEQYKEELEKKSANFDAVCKRLKKEKADVDQLEKFSFSQVLAKLAGKLEEKQEKEYQEYVEAKRCYDEANYGIEATKQEISRMEREIGQKEQAIKMKEEYLVTHFEEGKELNEKRKQQKEELLRMKKEYDEAIYAVEKTLRIADSISNSLSSAKSCATFDTFFNGGILADMAKYKEIEDAQSQQNALTEATNTMKRELKDVDFEFDNSVIQIDGTTKMFDVFFDNIFTDWRVRDEISTNYDKIETYISRLTDIRMKLLKEREETVQKADQCEL